jgi:hypothetical protein
VQGRNVVFHYRRNYRQKPVAVFGSLLMMATTDRRPDECDVDPAVTAPGDARRVEGNIDRSY